LLPHASGWTARQSKRYGWLNDRYGESWQISVGPLSDAGRAISPTLMFVGAVAGKAEQAMELYTSIFPKSKIGGILRYDGSTIDAKGTVQHAQFSLADETFMIMDSVEQHAFGFDEGASLVVTCKDQADVDRYWSALTENGGEESVCGWLKDRFGVSWQIVPEAVGRLMAGPAADRVMAALLQMRKLDIAALEAAAA
jgi:predicted 3-demethylubiquinone-9 3-methyltransferase (glyoxalase superfamily)